MSKDFFSDVEKEELTLSTGKTIELPVEYQEWMWIQALFPAPAKKVKRLLPSKKLKPLLLLPGVALISISAMEYRRIHEVEPYNEVAVSIPVQYNPLMNLRYAHSFLPALFPTHV